MKFLWQSVRAGLKVSIVCQLSAIQSLKSNFYFDIIYDPIDSPQAPLPASVLPIDSKHVILSANPKHSGDSTSSVGYHSVYLKIPDLVTILDPTVRARMNLLSTRNEI